ncbi:hypothetical protein ABK040_000538 [Willaertia magna]
MSQQNNNSSSTSSSPLNTQPSSSSFNKDEVEQQISKWKNKLKTFICPISQQLMTDPVMIPETGQTYDRKLIEQWLQRQNTCPTTGIKLKSKLLTPNYFAKSAINENIEKFIKKVIKNIKMWCSDVNLIDICSELVEESLDLIKNNVNFKIYQKELCELKFNILLNELNEDKLFDNYMKIANDLTDLEFKLIKLKELKNKLKSDKYLQKYYYELLSLLIELKNVDNNFLKETFTKYCKLNKLNNNLIEKVLYYIKTDEVKLDFLIILFNESDYNRNNLLQKLLNINIEKNKNKFIPFFKKLFKEINLNNIDLHNLVEFIKNYKNDLQNELIIIYKELYKKGNNIKYLEAIYDLNNKNKDIENQLLNEYLKLNLMDKYFNLFIKTNENKLDSFNLMLLKLLQNQNNEGI